MLRQMAPYILVNIGLGDSGKPSHESMLIYWQSGPLEYNSRKFESKYEHFILKMYLKISSCWCQPFCWDINVLKTHFSSRSMCVYLIN